ncbi:hypothetical protein [Reyranella sp.]|uniref:hypothetical protein n=1 Tax=Reyranella sp. TaxID=1929291 RepID=UPI003D0B3871
MFTDLLLFASVLVISGIVFLPLHVIAVRVLRGRNILSTVNIMVGASAVIGSAIGWLVLGGSFSSEGAKAVACVGAGFAFLGFGALYNLLGPTSVDRSISAHILNLIYQAPGHRMTKDDLFSFYTHSDVLEKRLVECAEIGVIERTGSQLALTPSGRRIGQFYAILGRVLGMRIWYLDRYHARATTAPGTKPT